VTITKVGFVGNPNLVNRDTINNSNLGGGTHTIGDGKVLVSRGLNVIAYSLGPISSTVTTSSSEELNLEDSIAEILIGPIGTKALD
jgi:hypothetical protein